MEGQDFRAWTEGRRKAAPDPSDFPRTGEEGEDAALGLVEDPPHTIGERLLPSPREG
jgi:hypothetical protein